MNVIRTAVVLLFASLFASSTAYAANTVLAGTFDGTEAETAPLPGTCTTPDSQLSYDASTTFQVGASGSYFITDAFNYHSADVTVLIYQGGFNPANPQTGLVTPLGVDWADFVSLSTGTEYTLVVQQWCENTKGAWAVTFTGPGSVSSAANRMVPLMTQGEFTASDPRATTDCAVDGQYIQTGPMQVSTTGPYFYADIFNYQFDSGVDACLQIYTAPFNASNPSANRVGFSLDDEGRVELVAGQNYYFVIQPLGNATEGEFFYVFAPPAPFRITKAMAGGWFDASTPGQGFFFDVYDDRNQMFAGWYTFDLSRPVDGTAELGEPGHRWLTAFGTIDGAVGNLDVYLAQGGVFDAADPSIDPQTVVGELTVEFTGCMTGTIDYSLTTPVVAGQINLQPLADSHVALCEDLVEVPGMPGPL